MDDPKKPMGVTPIKVISKYDGIKLSIDAGRFYVIALAAEGALASTRDGALRDFVQTCLDDCRAILTQVDDAMDTRRETQQ